ncbi:MAG: LysE family transporter [Simkaniaceae bacterium]|nr:LysE family transporter [Simkaniaceae bacterium]
MLPDLAYLFLKGAIAGLAYSFVSMSSDLYTANYVLTRNWATGFVAALGITLVQILWSSLAVIAMRFSIITLNANLKEFIFFGSLILIVMAAMMYQKGKKQETPKQIRPRKKLYIFCEGIVFALTTPSKIVGYLAIFVTIGIERQDPDFLSKTPLIAGVTIGALVWWILYLFVINKKREKISPNFVSTLQRISGIILLTFALTGIINAILL